MIKRYSRYKELRNTITEYLIKVLDDQELTSKRNRQRTYDHFGFEFGCWLLFVWGRGGGTAADKLVIIIPKDGEGEDTEEEKEEKTTQE